MRVHKHFAREPGDPDSAPEDKVSRQAGAALRTEKGNATMNGSGKSDGPIVPKKPSNKEAGAPVSAERAEGRGSAKGNSRHFPKHRTQSRSMLRRKLWRIRQVAEERKKERFTSLWHHIYDPNRLHECYLALNRKSATGVDKVTWKQYGEQLWRNLTDLAGRLARGAYKPKPVERIYIPKTDGRRRPIGKTALEDKIAQRSFVEVVGEIYEADFLGFSYGSRPERSAHDALDALSVGLAENGVSWVLDADIRGFFDAVDHEWMLKFLQHRIADRRVLRQVEAWLKAGVLEDGKKTIAETGTPQGGNISPLLANIYLHYAFDQWAHYWRHSDARGQVILVRYVDDFVVGFQYRSDAERFLDELKERLRKFNLELHPTKTRLLEFGRFAAQNIRRRGGGKPETFNFLGFTHMCSVNTAGYFTIRRHTDRKKMTAKLKELNIELKRRRHQKLADQKRRMSAILRGYYNYFGVPGNSRAINAFYQETLRHWWRALRRRSHKNKLGWAAFCRQARRWLPRPRITHPYPSQRLRVIT